LAAEVHGNLHSGIFFPLNQFSSGLSQFSCLWDCSTFVGRTSKSGGIETTTQMAVSGKKEEKWNGSGAEAQVPSVSSPAGSSLFSLPD